jgi:flagellar biosynthesis GTPase FlhF
MPGFLSCSITTLRGKDFTLSDFFKLFTKPSETEEQEKQKTGKPEKNPKMIKKKPKMITVRKENPTPAIPPKKTNILEQISRIKKRIRKRSLQKKTGKIMKMRKYRPGVISGVCSTVLSTLKNRP